MGKYTSQIEALGTPQKSKYADAIASFGAPKEKPKEADFFSPGEVVKRSAMGAVNTLPGAAALMNKVQGRDAYGTGVEGGSAMLGDASNALLTVLTAGKGLGAGAAINAGLEGSGVNEGMRKTGSEMESNINSVIGANLPSKVMGIEDLGTAINAITRIPGLSADLGANLIPAVSAGSARVPESIKARMPFGKGPAPIGPDVQGRAAFASAEGIPLTQGETLGKTSPAAVKEAGFRRSPGGEEAALGMQAKQQAAIREGLANRVENLGDNVLAGEIRQGSGMTEGRQLADVPEAAKGIRQERGQAVGSAKEALAQEIPIRSNFAKELKSEMKTAISKLKDAGPGSDRAKAKELLVSYLDHADNVKTMGSAIRFLDDFDSAIQGTMDRAKPDVKKVAFGSTRQKISSILDEAGKNLAPEEQANLKTAKAGFAEVADPAMDLKNMEETNPAALLRSISSGTKSLSKVQGFNKVFAEGTPQRQGLKSALVQDIIKKGTMKEGLSGTSMGKALEKIDQATLSEIFSDSPKELADIKSFVKGLSDIEAQRSPLGTSANGNSHTTPLAMAVKFAGLKLPGAEFLMQKLQKYRSGKAFEPYELEAPKAAKPPETKSMQGIRERFGVNPALFGRQMQATSQGQ